MASIGAPAYRKPSQLQSSIVWTLWRAVQKGWNAPERAWVRCHGAGLAGGLDEAHAFIDFLKMN